MIWVFYFVRIYILEVRYADKLPTAQDLSRWLVRTANYEYCVLTFELNNVYCNVHYGEAILQDNYIQIIGGKK